jgi:hypothetical protein
MVEIGEDLSLRPEALQNRVAVHRASNELDRHGLLEGCVGAPPEVHGSHPAVTDLLQDLVGADPVAGPRPRGGRRLVGVVEQRERLLGGHRQRPRAREQIRVAPHAATR